MESPDDVCLLLFVSGVLQKTQADVFTVVWIIDHLTDEPQYVKLMGSVSEKVLSSTGAPRGTVMSSFVFTLHLGFSLQLVVLSHAQTPG